MKITVEIPDYDGNGLDVIWEPGAKYAIRVEANSVVLSANQNGLLSLAKQLLYLAHNDLPAGSHVHFDSFFTGRDAGGTELVIEKERL